MVWAKKSEIFGPVISRISVDVVDVDGDSPGMRVALIPTAHATLFAVGCNQICSDMSGGLIEARRRAINITRKPPADVFIVMKGSTALVRAVNERVSADDVIATVTFADNDFSS